MSEVPRRRRAEVPWLVLGALIGIAALMGSTPWRIGATQKADTVGLLLQILAYAGGGSLGGLLVGAILNRLFPKI